MKKLLIILLFIPLIFACSGDDDNSNLTFFEKYDGVVWELETYNNGRIPDKSLSNSRIQLFNGSNSISTKAYFFEVGPSETIEECFSNQISREKLSSISENSFTYEDDIEITVFIVTDNGNSLSIKTRYKGGGGGGLPIIDTYFRTSLNNPCP